MLTPTRPVLTPGRRRYVVHDAFRQRRRPIELHAGQVWKTPDGVWREVLEISEQSVTIRASRRVTLDRDSLLAWISAKRAREAP
jgi:hypothetical protein